MGKLCSFFVLLYLIWGFGEQYSSNSMALRPTTVRIHHTHDTNANILFACTAVHTQIHTQLLTSCLLPCVTHTHAHKNTHRHMQTHTHTRTHMYTHTQTHTHSHVIETHHSGKGSRPSTACCYSSLLIKLMPNVLFIRTCNGLKCHSVWAL